MVITALWWSSSWEKVLAAVCMQVTSPMLFPALLFSVIMYDACMVHFSPILPNSTKPRASTSSRHRAGNGRTWFLGRTCHCWARPRDGPFPPPPQLEHLGKESRKGPGEKNAQAALGMSLMLFCQSTAIRSD